MTFPSSRPAALWIVRFCLLGLCTLGFLPGCESKHEVDKNFTDAMELFTQLDAASPDRCYLDPRMGRVELLLRQVPPSDYTYEAAQGLLKRIQSGRARLNAPGR